MSYIQLDRVANIQATNSDVRDLELNVSEGKREDSILVNANQFIHLSWKQRNALRQQEGDFLLRTRSGKMVKPLESDSLSQIPSGSIVRPLSVKQRKRLDCFPKQSFADYVKHRQ
jgi:hypothetical protein